MKLFGHGRGTALLGALLLALFFAPLADPGSVLVARDVLKFHLPLRASWAELAHAGAAQWDPFARGGQPLVSNPNYGALYPPSWIALLLTAHVALAWIVLAHAALAALGAARLARRLGADAWSALLAALAFTAGPTYLSLIHSLPLALGMSWLPWILAAALDLLAAPDRAARRRSTLTLAGALAMQTITGDPAMLLMTAIALAAFLGSAPRRALERSGALATAAALALGLAAAQLLPALRRLADTARAAGLDYEQATRWSFPWSRLVELAFPRFFGDLARPERNLYFGWGIHDRDYPYLLLLDISWPLLVLALTAWLRRGTTHRFAWLFAGGAGLFLALGRHNPLYPLALAALPGLDRVRYPEKFLLLALTAAIFTGAVAWRRLLDEREQNRRTCAELPAAIAGALALLACIFAALAEQAPPLVEWFVRAHSGLPPGPETLGRAQEFLSLESRVALAVAFGSVTLFLLARFTRLPRRALEVAALLLVASELYWYARPLAATLPAARLLERPRLLDGVARHPGRWYAEPADPRTSTDLVFTGGDATLAWSRAPVERLDPRIGNLFGAAYVFDVDYDLTATAPARRATDWLARLGPSSDSGRRLLGAWGVRNVVRRRTPEQMAAEFRDKGAVPSPAGRVENVYALPAVRFVNGAALFADASTAERAAEQAALPLDRTEYLIGAGELPAGPLGKARLDSVIGRGADFLISYTAESTSLLVVASTFDRNWRARLDDRTLPLYETAGGYCAVLVPPGERRLTLAYRDPWYAAGRAISVATLLAILAAGFAWRRRGESASYNAGDRAAP